MKFVSSEVSLPLSFPWWNYVKLVSYLHPNNQGGSTNPTNKPTTELDPVHGGSYIMISTLSSIVYSWSRIFATRWLHAAMFLLQLVLAYKKLFAIDRLHHLGFFSRYEPISFERSQKNRYAMLPNTSWRKQDTSSQNRQNKSSDVKLQAQSLGRFAAPFNLIDQVSNQHDASWHWQQESSLIWHHFQPHAGIWSCAKSCRRKEIDQPSTTGVAWNMKLSISMNYILEVHVLHRKLKQKILFKLLHGNIMKYQETKSHSFHGTKNIALSEFQCVNQCQSQ